MIKKLTDLQKLSLDTYRGTVKNYSVSDANEAIKNAILEACGGEWNSYNFMKNKYDVYQVLVDVLSIGTGELIEDKFNDFAEVHDTELGDTTTFMIEDNSLFRVSSIADGNTDIRRQKLYGKKLTVTTEKLAIKIYTELDLFLAGRVDWTRMIDRVMQSFSQDIGLRIYNAIYDSYGSLSTPYAKSGTFEEDVLSDMIAHVEAQTGQRVVIYGTNKALGKITSVTPSEKMKDEINAMGHFGQFKGRELLELPQAHKAGTNEFAVADDFLLVVPNGEKIVKIVFEGNPYIYDTPAGVRNDEQLEYFFARKVGIAVLKASQYGFYKIA